MCGVARRTDSGARAGGCRSLRPTGEDSARRTALRVPCTSHTSPTWTTGSAPKLSARSETGVEAAGLEAPPRVEDASATPAGDGRPASVARARRAGGSELSSGDRLDALAALRRRRGRDWPGERDQESDGDTLSAPEAWDAEEPARDRWAGDLAPLAAGRPLGRREEAFSAGEEPSPRSDLLSRASSPAGKIMTAVGSERQRERCPWPSRARSCSEASRRGLAAPELASTASPAGDEASARGRARGVAPLRVVRAPMAGAGAGGPIWVLAAAAAGDAPGRRRPAFGHGGEAPFSGDGWRRLDPGGGAASSGELRDLSRLRATEAGAALPPPPSESCCDESCWTASA